MDGQSESRSEGSLNDADGQYSRRKFVKRAATIGAAASAIAWTAPGMTSIALAGDDGKGGKGGDTVPVGTGGGGGKGGGGGGKGGGGKGGGGGGKGKGSPVPVGPGHGHGTSTTQDTSTLPGSSDTDTDPKGSTVPVGKGGKGCDTSQGVRALGNDPKCQTGGVASQNNGNSGSGSGDPSAAGANGDPSGGDPSAAQTGSGGSLPFTGGNGRDLVLAGAGMVVLGRVLYEMRRVGGAPARTDEPPQTPTPA
jgi:hypothetical protein